MATVAALECLPVAPDVLRRFVRAEHVRRVGDHSVASNDSEFAEELASELRRQRLSGALRWKVIVDLDLVAEWTEAARIVLGETQYVLFGQGAMFGLDWASREVFGFVSAGMPAELRRSVVIATVMQVVNESC